VVKDISRALTIRSRREFRASKIEQPLGAIDAIELTLLK
jgi:hypothetical protein